MYSDERKLYFKPYDLPHNKHPCKHGCDSNDSKSCRDTQHDSWQTRSVYTQLEGHYKRHVGAELYPRIHYRPGFSGTPTSRIEILSSRDREPHSRGSENDNETSGITDTPTTLQQGILIPTFFCPKEGRGHETHYQPQGSEQICGDSPLQDGGYPDVERYPQNRRLDDKSRPEGCLLHDIDGITLQTSVVFQMAGTDIPIQLPPIRSVVCTLGLYQDHKTSGGHTQIPRTEGHNIHRRHTDHGSIAHSGKRAHSRLDIPAGELGVYHKPPKVTPDTYTGNRLPGLCSQLHRNGDKTTWRQDQADPPGHKQAAADTTASSNNAFQVVGEAKPCSPGYTPSPTLLQKPPAVPTQGTGGNSRGRDYTAHTQLTPAARQELCWWQEHLTRWNGRYLLGRRPNMVIETDSSTTGWGALCQEVRTGGPWSQTKSRLHINCLKLLAATLAIKSFVKKRDLHVHLKMDNTTALTYINKFGGTVSPELNRLTKELWLWCLDRNITLEATHLPGVKNCTADEESRVMRDRSDWMLCPRVFSKVNHKTGPLQVNLFASRLTHQLMNYVSWRPDPEAMATDAFTLDWTKSMGYANPPWNLVGRVLTHVRSQQAKVTLIAPIWRAQVWYPILLEMLVQEPLLLPASPSLILLTHRVNKPEVTPPLAAWVISGRDSEVKTFQRRLQSPPVLMETKSYDSLFGKWVR